MDEELVKKCAKALNELDRDWFGTFTWHILDPQERAAYRDMARAALAAIEAAGFKVVPVEPTEEMIREGWLSSDRDGWDGPASTWDCMLSATPKQP